MAQEIIPNQNRFGREFRLDRFNYAIARRVEIEKNKGDVVFQEIPMGIYQDKETEVVRVSYAYAQRILAFGIISLYQVVMREGDINEQTCATQTIRILERYLHNDPSVPSLEIGSCNT